MNLYESQIFRKEFGLLGNMTVSTTAGPGRNKEARGRKSPGIQFKLSTVREVMKIKNQMGATVKKRLMACMEKKESKLEEEFQMMKLEKEMKEMKKGIQNLLKKAKKECGEIPRVRVRLQVTYPEKEESILLREKDVKAGRLKEMGIPGALSLEKAVAHVQAQIDDVRKQHSSMMGEAGKLLNTLKALEN